MVFNYGIPIQHNIKPFSEVCHDVYGRKIIKTKRTVINLDNIADDLANALPAHHANAEEIDYLDRYYRGDQPILYREKTIRPEINNKVVETLAQYIVTGRDKDGKAMENGKTRKLPIGIQSFEKLREGGYITMKNRSPVCLTDKGYSIARQFYDRYLILKRFLVQLGVDEQTATKDACRMEHDLSDYSFSAISVIFFSL